MYMAELGGIHYSEFARKLTQRHSEKSSHKIFLQQIKDKDSLGSVQGFMGVHRLRHFQR